MQDLVNHHTKNKINGEPSKWLQNRRFFETHNHITPYKNVDFPEFVNNIIWLEMGYILSNDNYEQESQLPTRVVCQ